MRHRPTVAPQALRWSRRASRIAATVTLLAGTFAASNVMPAPAVANGGAPNVEVAGSIQAPTFGGGRSGNNGILISPDGRWLYNVTFGYVLRADLTTYSVERRIDVTGALTGASAVSADGATAYLLFGIFGGVTAVQELDLTTGVLGDRVEVGTTANHGAESIAIHESGGGVIAYVYERGDGFRSVDPAIVAIDLVSGVWDRTSLAAAPFSRPPNRTGSLAVSGDGTELYLSTPESATPIEVIDTSDMTLDRTMATSANRIAIHVADGATKGELFAVQDGTPATLRVIDLDDSDDVTRTVTLGSSASRAMFVHPDGSAAVTHLAPVMDLIPAGSGTAVTTDFAGSFPDPVTTSNTLGVLIEVNPTHGTCVFATNNHDAYLTAFSVDGADCGPFSSGFGPLTGEVPIDGSITMSITPPTPGAREVPWLGVGVFVDGILRDVLQPPFGSSITIDWADVSPGRSVELRAYNQSHLDAASLASLDDVDADTTFLHSRSTDIAYEPRSGDIVAAGSEHSCAITAGVLSCWGSNGDGQLGDGTFDDALVAVPVADVDAGFVNADVTAVTAGGAHTCAITSGTLYCWGDNSSGRLGDGTDSGRTVPTRVADVDGGFTNADVTAVAAGADHTCAISSGTVYCWGDNGTGRLGDGTTTERLVPTRVADVTGGFTNADVTAVAAGDRHSCAVADGIVHCWGRNSDGQLGDDGGSNSSVAVRVADVTGGFTNADATAVAAGADHSCAIADGSAYCWGSNENSQLGDDSGDGSSTPVRVIDVTGGFTNVSVAAVTIGPDGIHTCALTTSVIHCWGANDDEQIGDGTSDERGEPTAAGDVSGGFTNASVTSIAAGDGHTCVVADGRLYCWGSNSYGQLGDGTTASQSTAVGVCCDSGGSRGGDTPVSDTQGDGPAGGGTVLTGPAVGTGQGASERRDGTRTELVASDAGPDTVRYASEGLAIEVVAANGTTARAGLFTAPDGALVVEVCADLLLDGVIEVRSFSEPRLLAAHRVVEGDCQSFTIPLATPLDGGALLSTGVHTLQFALPTPDGIMLVNIGFTIAGTGQGAATLLPNSIPAGEGPQLDRLPLPTTPLILLPALLALVLALRRPPALRSGR
jgi:alpha-tubulin suppressor-like RCC1 family protein